MTICSIMNNEITGLPNSSLNFWKLWGCRKEPNWDGGPHTCNITLIFNNNSAAGCVKLAMKWNNPMLFWVISCGQQAEGTAGTQTPMCGGHSYLPLDDILWPPAEDIINDIGEGAGMRMMRHSVHIQESSGRPNRFPNVPMEASKVDYYTAAILWSHPTVYSWSLCWLWAKRCCWGWWGLARRVQSHSESPHCRLFGQYDACKQPPSCKPIIVLMECTSCTVVQDFAWFVGIFLALWRVDRWVIIWSCLVRFWVSVWCFVYFIITAFLFMYEGLCEEITMMELIVEIFVFGNGIVAAIGHHIWLSHIWLFGIFTQLKLAWDSSEVQMHFSSLR